MGRNPGGAGVPGADQPQAPTQLPAPGQRLPMDPSAAGGLLPPHHSQTPGVQTWSQQQPDCEEGAAHGCGRDPGGWGGSSSKKQAPPSTRHRGAYVHAHLTFAHVQCQRVVIYRKSPLHWLIEMAGEATTTHTGRV